MKQWITLLCTIPFFISAKAQYNSIQATVTTRDHKPVINVSVMIKQLNRYMVTDSTGAFFLQAVPDGRYTIRFSHTGLETITKEIDLRNKSNARFTIVLQETNAELQEVMIESRRTSNQKTVSINRLPVQPMDLPQSVTILGKNILESQQVQRLSDAIRNVTGVYLSSTRGSTQENFSARGYPLSSNNLFKDGVRINSGTMPEMSSLENIEVLKGSSAILFGNVAPGGIVNLVTKQPRFISGGDLSVRTGSYGLCKPHFDLYGPLTTSIAYRINGMYETAMSYRDNVQSKRYYLNPSLLYHISKKTELLLQGDYLKHDFTPDFGIGSINNTSIPDVPRTVFFGTAWQYAHTIQSSITATIKHKFSNAWQLASSVSRQNYHRDYYSTERIQALANGDWYRPLNRAKNSEEYLIAQANITGRFTTGKISHTLITGIDADQYHTKAWTYNQPSIYDTINILDPSKYRARTDIPDAKETKLVTTPTVRFGIYIQDLLNIHEKVKLLLGIRWSLQEAKAAATTDLISGVSSLSNIKTDKAFSPRIGIVYQPTKHNSLFLSYANSFSVNNGTDVYGNAISPSIIDQYEIGSKNDFFSGKLTANLTLYRIINNNLAQTALFAADGITPNNNTALKALTGQTRSDGAEIDIIAHPLQQMDIMAGYSYNFIRYTRTPNAKGNYIEGERLQGSVGSTANSSITYRFRNWKFSGVIVYTGPRTAGFNNTKGQTQNYNRLFTVNGFTTIDIGAGYGWKKINIQCKVSNLANTYNYYTHENYSINPIPPRQLMLTLRYQF